MASMDIDAAGGGSNTQASAAVRALRIPEILRHILAHTERDQVDLVSAAQVSRGFRAVAVPLLTRNLDVPLSDAKGLYDLLGQRLDKPLQHVRNLRIWDDEVHQRFRHEKHSQPSSDNVVAWRSAIRLASLVQSPAEIGDNRYSFRLSDLLHALVEQKNRFQLPFVDLSFGLLSSPSVRRLWKAFPLLARRIAAIRVVVDFYNEDDGATWTSRNGTDGPLCWTHLTTMVAEVCQLQDQSNDPTLKHFTIESFSNPSVDNRRMDKESWQRLADALPSRLESLTLFLSRHDGENGHYRLLLEAHWPKLRHITIVAIANDLDIELAGVDNPVGPDHWPGLAEAMDAFLDRHLHLEGVTFIAPHSRPGLRLTQKFDAIRSIRVVPAGRVELSAFLLRHPTLVDAYVPAHAANSRALADMPGLRIVRGSSFSAADCARMAATVYQPDPVRYLNELEFDDSQEAFRNITGFSLTLREEDEQECVVQLGALFHPVVFPNLRELVITLPFSSDSRRPTDAVTALSRILLALRYCHSLRALYFDATGMEPLPEDSNLQEAGMYAPTFLKYISWHAPAHNKTQHYMFKPVSCFLQRLPSSTRLRVGADGVWSQSSFLRSDKFVLDHSFLPHY
ncbi:hypothetical protein OC835_002221 [Tilletia horrida]|nr:hypothetical protein OC835_002221 [Tilletia horrida]